MWTQVNWTNVMYKKNNKVTLKMKFIKFCIWLINDDYDGKSGILKWWMCIVHQKKSGYTYTK